MLKPMLTDTIGTTTARWCKIIQGIQTRITDKPTQACRFTDMQPITMKLCVVHKNMRVNASLPSQHLLVKSDQ